MPKGAGIPMYEFNLDDKPRFLPPIIIKRGKHNIVCPDVLAFLGNVPAGELDWTVTLDMTGFPFRD